MQIPIGAPTPQSKDGNTYVFSHWQSGGAQSRTITIGESDSVYTAVFNASGASCASGTILREVWNDISGTSISSIPVSTLPDASNQLSIFEAPGNYGDNYGQRIRGFICPPTDGNYTFWIASDNSSELWLSTDESSSNKSKIASVTGYTASREWNKYPSQKSAAIPLIAGTKYYIEALHKEGDRSDNLAVGWLIPNGSQERPIPGSRLAPFTPAGNNPPQVSITSPYNNYSHTTPANITIKADASASSGSTITKVEFFHGSTKIGEDLTAPYSFTWMNVTTGNYALKAKATDNNNLTSYSQVVNLIITSCITPVITPAGSTTMCSGSVLLKANTGSGFAYQWKKDGNDIGGATGSTYTASSSGYYQVKIIQGSCISWSAPTKVSIGSGLRAAITPGGPTTFCDGGSVKLYSNTCSGYTYQWRKNSADIAGATGATYTATTSGEYQIKITQSGQHAWSEKVQVTLKDCREPEDTTDTSDNELTAIVPEHTDSSSFQMKVYPNPNNGLFTILINMPTVKEEKIKLSIVNVLGQEVYKKEFTASEEYIKETVELDNSLKTGIYTLQLIIGNKVESTSIVLSR
jgi:hypothetical protein